jgi:hypothetical protein
MKQIPGLPQTIIGAFVMAVVSALADAFWAAALPEHRTIYGLVHGATVLGVLGLVLARLAGARRPALAGLGGVLVGLFAAGLFYVLYALLGNPALIIAWMALWVAFAFLTDLTAPTTEAGSRTLARGMAAAALSAIPFFILVGGAMWLGAHDPGPLYLRNVVYWAIAFLPGFAALLLWRSGD